MEKAAWTFFINSPSKYNSKQMTKGWGNNDRNVTPGELFLHNRLQFLDVIVFFWFCCDIRLIHILFSFLPTASTPTLQYADPHPSPYCTVITPQTLRHGWMLAAAQRTEEVREKVRGRRKKNEGERSYIGNRVKVEYLLEWAIWRQTVCTWARVPE